LALFAMFVAAVWARPAAGVLPEGWEETCTYYKPAFLMELDHKPTEQEDAQLLATRTHEMEIELDRVKEDAATKQRWCQTQYGALKCAQDVWRNLRTQNLAFLGIGVGSVKPKYVNYLKVHRIGHENSEIHIDQYLQAEAAILLNKICEHRQGFWSAQQFILNGRFYDKMHRIFFESENDLMFKSDKLTISQDMNVFTQNYCALPDRFNEQFKAQLVDDGVSSAFLATLHQQSKGEGTIRSGLSKDKAHDLRAQAYTVYEDVWSACRPDNARMAAGYLSCRILEKYGSNTGLAGICEQALRDNTFTNLC